MKTGKTLVELATEIQRQADAKRDFAVDTRDIQVLTRDENHPNTRFIFDGGEFNITPHTHSQLAQYTKVPKVYYDRMLTEAPGLYEQTMREWLDQKAERRMVRTLDGNGRAFVSTKFDRSKDNDTIASAALPIIGERGMDVVSAEITERKLYIKAIDRLITTEVKQGDVLNWGIAVSNSEIGQGSVSVRVFQERLVCSNGMISTEMLRKTHLTRDEGELGEYYRTATVRQMERTFSMQLKDILNGMLTSEFVERETRKLRVAAISDEIENPVKGVEVLSNQLGLNETEGNSVLEHLIRGNDLTRYGLANAVTRTAEDALDYDRASELERYGMKVIEATASQWRDVVTAS